MDELNALKLKVRGLEIELEKTKLKDASTMTLEHIGRLENENRHLKARLTEAERALAGMIRSNRDRFDVTPPSQTPGSYL